MEAGATAVETDTLSSVLQRHNAPRIIDFMSLDVEGAEELVMQSFPWERYVLTVLTIENTPPGLRSTLLTRGYKALCTLGRFDTVFVHYSTFEQQVGAVEAKELVAAGQKKQLTCHEIILPRAPVCAAAHASHLKSKYRITGQPESWRGRGRAAQRPGGNEGMGARRTQAGEATRSTLGGGARP